MRDLFTQSELFRDPHRLNVFMFALDSQGSVIHEFHGLPAGARAVVPGRSNHEVEIRKAREKLKVEDLQPRQAEGPLKGLPDLAATPSALPAGVRMFIRQDDPSNTVFSKMPIVEVVAMTEDEWKPLAYSAIGKEIDADVLKSWLVWFYPAAIRAADEQKRFQKFSGTLMLEPAGSDEKFRHALLRGKVRLSKGNDAESSFEGELEAVLTYRLQTDAVHSVRGVVYGTYLYRTRGTNPQKLRVAIESRPN